MMKLFKPKRANSILGISFDGNHLEAVVLRRGNNSFQPQKSVSIPLALSPLSGDPQLVGREIRNHLNAAGIKEKRCAVSLPLNWVLTVQAAIPEMPEEDVGSFLEIESERGFHAGAESLSIATSRARAVNGEQAATLLGIPRNHLVTLERVLKAAQLKPVTFTIGVAALAAAKPPGKNSGVLTIALAQHGIDLEISAGGGIVALRSFDVANESEGAGRGVDADLIARELRITLGQLSPAFHEGITQARIYGRGFARQSSSEIARRLETMGLKTEIMERVSDVPFNPAPSADIAVSPALAVAAGYLRDQLPPMEFLPPKVRPWQNLLTAKFSARRLAYAGGAVAVVLLAIIGAFVYQSVQLSKLNGQWAKLDPQVADLQKDQDQIRRFRSYYDTSFRGMRILRTLTESFPVEGSVTAKNLDIRDLSNVTCSGVARDNQSYLGLIDRLSKHSEITGLKTDMVRGQSPVQFTFNFQWEGGQTSGN